MDIVDTEHNRLENGASRRAKIELWTATSELRKYLIGLTFSEEQTLQFRSVAENWGRLYIDCFGEQHVTHYMVSYLTAHSIFLIQLSKGQLNFMCPSAILLLHYLCVNSM